MFIPFRQAGGKGRQSFARYPIVPPKMAKNNPRTWFNFQDLFPWASLQPPGVLDLLSGDSYSNSGGSLLYRSNGTFGFGNNANSYLGAHPSLSGHFLPATGRPFTAFFADWHVVKYTGHNAYFMTNDGGPPWHHFRLPAGWFRATVNDDIWDAFSQAPVVSEGGVLNIAVCYDGASRMVVAVRSDDFNNGEPITDVNNSIAAWNSAGRNYLFSYFQTGGTFGVWGSYGDVSSFDTAFPEGELLKWAEDPYSYWRRSELFFVPVAGAPPSNEVDIELPPGSLSVTGYAPSISAPSATDIELPHGSVNVTGHVPQVDAPLPADVDLPHGAIGVTGYVPSVEAPFPVAVDLPPGGLQVTGYAPSVEISGAIDVDLPHGSVSITGYAPIVSAGAGEESLPPPGFIGVTGYVPSVEAPFPIDVDLPVGSVSVTGYAPTVTGGAGSDVNLPHGSVNITGFAPTVEANAPVDIDLPHGVLQIVGYAPTVDAGEETDVDLPYGSITITGYAPLIDANEPITVDLPSGAISVRGYAPKTTYGRQYERTLQDGLEMIKDRLKPLLESVGLDQTLWPNIPKKRDSTKPFAQIFLGVEDRILSDFAGTNRTECSLVVSVYTPYGNTAKAHDTYVNDVMKLMSDTNLDFALFFTSVPNTLGRRDSWWVTQITTPFILEGI